MNEVVDHAAGYILTTELTDGVDPNSVLISHTRDAESGTDRTGLEVAPYEVLKKEDMKEDANWGGSSRSRMVRKDMDRLADSTSRGRQVDGRWIGYESVSRDHRLRLPQTHWCC